MGMYGLLKDTVRRLAVAMCVILLWGAPGSPGGVVAVSQWDVRGHTVQSLDSSVDSV